MKNFSLIFKKLLLISALGIIARNTCGSMEIEENRGTKRKAEDNNHLTAPKYIKVAKSNSIKQQLAERNSNAHYAWLQRQNMNALNPNKKN